MFGYYGSKSKIAKLYPQPIYDTIIEPFAGSARYSLYAENWKKSVRLYDLDEYVCAVWAYLIAVKKEEILALPDVANGECLDNFKLTQEQKWLMGFHIQSGVNAPRKTASSVGNYNSWNRDKFRIAETLYKVRHWNIERKSYADVDNPIATWFIDPPYQTKGRHYRKSSKAIDFVHLGHWTRTRNGQVIACENIDATWVPFMPLVTLTGASHKVSVEGIFTQTNDVASMANQTVIDHKTEPPLA